ncbi:hypothetical protein PVAG01_03622 [Phlyctema vagabunda]|uniref:Uncharacterized protein n=1 Tax=Phlyctema vagabunda TaxID=108571 RepID=A0ABR4PN24_9HELO
MHRPTPSTQHNGLFAKRVNLFGGSKASIAAAAAAAASTATRPHTSSGSPSTHSELSHPPRPPGFSRKPSFTSIARPRTTRGRGPSNPVPPNPNVLLEAAPRAKSQSQTHRARETFQDDHPLPLPVIPLVRLDQSYQEPRSGESDKPAVDTGEGFGRPRISESSTAPYSNIMLVRPQTGNQSIGGSNGFGTGNGPASPTLETITYQHIQEMASKRISTLDYLRKAHEGRVYWFNTLLFNKPDLQRMPYFDSRKMARRATNYLLLGLSLPTILDLNGSNAQDFLKSFNALLAEFETYQQIHPPDGSSSLSRGRFPQMFKRATTTVGKGRRVSSAADSIGLPMGYDNDFSSGSGGIPSGGPSSSTSFPNNEADLLPGEEYALLLTPSLPFEPDFYETFATLCDVLIDCYTRLMGLVASPKDCSPFLAEMFTKADARVRKIIVQGVVKEFEDSSRGGVKSEVAGVGKVVLGGLI